MRRVVGRDRVDRAVGESFPQRAHVTQSAQWRIDFGCRVIWHLSGSVRALSLETGLLPFAQWITVLCRSLNSRSRALPLPCKRPTTCDPVVRQCKVVWGDVACNAKAARFGIADRRDRPSRGDMR